MPIEHPQFPVRPSRKLGESLAGYVSRHHGTNGHWAPEALHRAVATVYRGGTDTQARFAAWQIVCRVVGKHESGDEERWLQRTMELSIAAIQGGRWVRAEYLDLRICPECLLHHGIHLAIWDLPLVVSGGLNPHKSGDDKWRRKSVAESGSHLWCWILVANAGACGVTNR